jgi:hypothetical protein
MQKAAISLSRRRASCRMVTLIGWKKCRDGLLVKLAIPSKAERSHAFGRKCRAEFAKVLEITDGKKKHARALSLYTEKFVYRVGRIARPEAWDKEWMNECGGGIHFFITKAEAEAWQA